eukprot:g9738.t1
MDLIAVSKQVGLLKRVPRTGWVRRGVSEPESVAEHSHRMAVLALLYGPGVSTRDVLHGGEEVENREIDVMRCCRMALVHDLAEGIVGDLVVDGDAQTRDPITKEEKQKLEEKAIQEILGVKGRNEEAEGGTSGSPAASRSPPPAPPSGAPAGELVQPQQEQRQVEARAELLALWHEYEAQQTAEAIFVKDLDRLEMLLQADDYLDEEKQPPGLNLDDFYRSTENKFRSPVARRVDAALRAKHKLRRAAAEVPEAEASGGEISATR